MNRIIFVLAFLCSGIIFSQTAKEKEEAHLLALEAIKKMDAGQVDESIQLLKKSQKLDLDNMNYPYELGYASYLNKDYKATISYLEPLTKHKDRSDRVFQLLGNAYDMQGKPDEAIETYEKGKKAFPNSGKFYHEIGIVHMNNNRFSEAIISWEEGVKVEPYYGSNYYRLARNFANTEELFWSIFYAEMFILIEPNTARTQEISELLYKVYQASYTGKGDKGEVNLTKAGFNIYLDDKDLKKKNVENALKIPFEGQYATAYSVGSIMNYQNGVTSPSIYKVKETTLKAWFAKDGGSRDYQNVLLSYQEKMRKEGYLEVYTLWCLSYGDTESWSNWIGKEENKVKFNEFADWFNINQFTISKEGYLTRLDYLK